MMPFITDMFSAMALGLCIAMPFGPIGLMCAERTLAFGIWSGIASGLGAATAHGVFSCFAAMSATVLAQMTLPLHTPLRIAGGIVLVLMGVRAILVSPHAAHRATCGDLFSAYISALLIAAVNPMTILPYLGVASALETGKPLILDRALATPIGVTFGSASWYLALTLSTNAMLRLNKVTLDQLNRLAGILLIIIGAALCACII
jgi:threonine/homoserine/homoserine lactone efflux protein